MTEWCTTRSIAAVVAMGLASEGFSLSTVSTETQELSVTLHHRTVDSLAYAA